MKKLLTLLITILLSLLVSSNVFAEDVYMDGSLFYTIDNDEITIIKYTGNDTKVEIPMTIGGFNVTQISEDAFANKKIDEIKLPDTIKNISKWAFDDIDRVNVKFYDENEKIVKKEIPIDKPIVEEKEDPKPIDDPSTKEEDDPKSHDNDPKKEEDKKDEKESSNVDTSGRAEVGDNIEEHSDMISDMHTSSREEIVEEEKNIIESTNPKENIVVDEEVTSKTSTVNYPIFIVIGFGCIGIAYYLIRKKNKQ